MDSLEEDVSKALELAEAEAEPAPTDSAASDEIALDRAAQPESPRLGLSVLAWGSVAASLFLPLSWSGIWDPHEFEVAELSRRIAIHLMGAPNLSLEGADNTIPILSDLAKGQLPFSSIAFGFKLFGLHEWAGRLPLALWGLLGIIATYVLIKRLLDRSAALFSVLMLASCPLYFLHARTMLGDIVTMASLAIAIAGLGLAVFDRDVFGKPARCLGALLVGLLGLLAGFACRGVLIGVAVPALGVALAWLLLKFGRGPRSRNAGDIVAVLAGLIGVLASVIGARALLQSTEQTYSMLVGAEILLPRKLLTHDSVLHSLGFALLPWSAIVPFALGAVLRPSLASSERAVENDTALRMLIVTIGSLAILTHGILAQWTGDLPFSAVFVFAAALSVMARDFEKGRSASIATGIGAAALLVLFYEDFKNFPEKGFNAFVVGAVKMPESFEGTAQGYVKYGTLVALLLCLASFLESDQPTSTLVPKARSLSERARGWLGSVRQRVLSIAFWRESFDRRDYAVWPNALRALLKGNPLYTIIPLELILVALALVVQAQARGIKLLQAPWIARIPKGVGSYAWLGVLVALSIPFLLLLVRDAARGLFRLAAVTRASVACAGLACFGLILSLGYYPALASQISPKQVFDSYRMLAHDGEELAMVGESTGTAAYYAKGKVETFVTASQAFGWLAEAGAPRRFLIVSAKDSAKLNSLYRASVTPARNLPVLDARSSEIFLVSNQLNGAVNQSPFEQFVLNERPRPAHPIEATFEKQLDCLGWEITTVGGEIVDTIESGNRYKLRIYYEVLSPVTGTWKTFVHLDGTERINLDHDTVQDKYPFNLWNKGDFLVDIHEFEVPRTYAAGRYGVHFGLFVGSKRKPVSRGDQVDNRLNAGSIQLR